MKLYLETTIPNFLFADDAPEKRRVTEVFFQWMKVCRDELFVSALVESEWARAARVAAASAAGDNGSRSAGRWLSRGGDLDGAIKG